MTSTDALTGSAACDPAGEVTNGSLGALRVTPECPRLAPGLQLVGELRDSGFADRQWLVRKDGHFVQVTELLYRVLEQIDGAHSLDEIAAGITESTDRLVTAADVQRFIDVKLIPHGLVDSHDQVTAPATARPTTSPLTLAFRRDLFGPGALDRLTGVMQVLYARPVFIALLLAIGIAEVWLYRTQGPGEIVRSVLFTPGALLFAFVTVMSGGLFHELGHVSALRYGGGRADSVGMGVYVVFPTFYSDVTDCYRLGRWARVRTGFGGIFFDLVMCLAMIGAYFATGYEVLLFTVLLINLGIAYEFLPFVRGDGYWMLADLTGIGDFYSKVGPFLRSTVRSRSLPPGEERLPPLKPWVRVAFTTYILAVGPMLALFFVFIMLRLPVFAVTTWAACLHQVELIMVAIQGADPLGGLAAATQLLLLLLSVVAAVYGLGRGIRWLAGVLYSWSGRSIARRVAASVMAASSVALLIVLWVR